MKTKHRDDGEARESIYRDWRWDLGFGVVSNVDQVEWRYIGGVPDPVAIIEVTMRENLGFPPPGDYFRRILGRYNKETQGVLAKRLAERLDVSCYIVVYQDDLAAFWIHNWSKGGGWYERDQDGYVRWLQQLRRG